MFSKIPREMMPFGPSMAWMLRKELLILLAVFRLITALTINRNRIPAMPERPNM